MYERVSHQQLELLLEFMNKYGDLSATCKLAVTKKRWEELTMMLNSNASGARKTSLLWSKVWSDWKNRVKKKANQIRFSDQETGGGPPTNRRLTDIEEKLVGFMGPSVFGLDQPEIGFPETLTEPLPCTSQQQTETVAASSSTQPLLNSSSSRSVQIIEDRQIDYTQAGSAFDQAASASRSVPELNTAEHSLVSNSIVLLDDQSRYVTTPEVQRTLSAPVINPMTPIDTSSNQTPSAGRNRPLRTRRATALDRTTIQLREAEERRELASNRNLRSILEQNAKNISCMLQQNAANIHIILEQNAALIQTFNTKMDELMDILKQKSTSL